MTPAFLLNSSRLTKDFGIVVLSAMPMIENKGSTLLAAALNMKWYIAYLCTCVGSFLPTPFLLKQGGDLLSKLRRYPGAGKALNSVDAFVAKHPRFFKRHAYFSILVVISIPFTGIGIWAGCALCNLLGLEKKRSLWMITLAIIVSGLITTLTTYGIVIGVRSLKLLF